MPKLATRDEACMAAAELISRADGVLITAGAGMGIDSGMPDFRGKNGFWTAYPALQGLGMDFYDIATPNAFHTVPAIAWGFYGHRLALYRRIAPHAGFAMLREIAAHRTHGAFIFTSNVDGHFQKAGFDAGQVVECHGTIHRMQCLGGCGQPSWPADDVDPAVDIDQCTLVSDLPRCPSCAGLARPNILMFNDDGWDSAQTDDAVARMRAWRARVQRPVVMEIGAGTAISTVRGFGQGMNCPLIRINPFESGGVLPRDIAIAMSALDGISAIHRALAALHHQGSK